MGHRLRGRDLIKGQILGSRGTLGIATHVGGDADEPCLAMLLVVELSVIGEGVFQEGILEGIFSVGRTPERHKADAPDRVAMARHRLLYVVCRTHSAQGRALAHAAVATAMVATLALTPAGAAVVAVVIAYAVAIGIGKAGAIRASAGAVVADAVAVGVGKAGTGAIPIGVAHAVAVLVNEVGAANAIGIAVIANTVTIGVRVARTNAMMGLGVMVAALRHGIAAVVGPSRSSRFRCGSGRSLLLGLGRDLSLRRSFHARRRLLHRGRGGDCGPGSRAAQGARSQGGESHRGDAQRHHSSENNGKARLLHDTDSSSCSLLSASNTIQHSESLQEI